MEPLKNYVVAILNNFDNDMKLSKVEAISPTEAMYTALLNSVDTDNAQALTDYEDWISNMRTDKFTEEQIKNELFSGDINIGVLEI